MLKLPQTNTIAFERYIDLALDDKIPWTEFVVLMNTFIATFDDSQKFIMALLKSLKNLKMKFLDKKKNINCELINLENSDMKHSIPEVNKNVIQNLEQETKLHIESVTSLKDDFIPKKSDQSIGIKLKKESTNVILILCLKMNSSRERKYLNLKFLIWTLENPNQYLIFHNNPRIH